MQIKITGNRGPWINGKPRENGWEGEVDETLGRFLIENGLAERKQGRPAKKVSPNDLDD